MSPVMVYQPIVRQQPDNPPEVVAYEALWRPDRSTPTHVWAQLRDGPDLVAQDLACLAAGWQQRPPLAPGIRIHVNVFPLTLRDPGFDRWLANHQPKDPLVLEIVEDPWLQDTAGELRLLRRAGFVLALDDVDAQPHWPGLLDQAEPQVIKLNRGLLGLSDGESAVRRVVAWAREHDASVVAEGVEAAAEIARYHALGVTAFQGFWFGRGLRWSVPAAG